MRIDYHTGFDSKRVAEYDVRRLACNARQFEHFVHRNQSASAGGAAHAAEMKALSVEVRAFEREAERNADAASKLDEVKSKLKALR